MIGGDLGLFVFGCVVTLIAAWGGGMYAYTVFRSEYARQNQFVNADDGDGVAHALASDVRKPLRDQAAER